MNSQKEDTCYGTVLRSVCDPGCKRLDQELASVWSGGSARETPVVECHAGAPRRSAGGGSRDTVRLHRREQEMEFRESTQNRVHHRHSRGQSRKRSRLPVQRRQKQLLHATAALTRSRLVHFIKTAARPSGRAAISFLCLVNSFVSFMRNTSSTCQIGFFFTYWIM